jgi:multidrug efflux system membrane fusion protein
MTRALPAGRRTRRAFFVVGLCAALAGCGGDSGAPQGAARQAVQFPVETQPVSAQNVEYSVGAVGSVEAFETVTVTARVQGVVERVIFEEGDGVTPAQALAEIEPRRFALAVDSAQAALDRAQAELREAEAGLRRREAVNAKNPDLVKAEDVDAFRTQVQVKTADVHEKRAALDLARLNQQDAYVRAPVAGIIQTRTVQTGLFVSPGTVIATLVRREPLLLRFRVPEQEAAPLAPGQTAKFTVGGSQKTFAADISLVSAAASETSRMVEVTARISDPDRELRPGAFAQVRVPVGEAKNSPVIPQTAVRPSERGFLAFVVEDGVAKERVLTLGLRTADGLVEVRSGLRPGEQLVVRGSEALRDGAAVKVTPAPPGGAA